MPNWIGSANTVSWAKIYQYSKRHDGKANHSIEVDTLEGRNSLCLKSYKIEGFLGCTAILATAQPLNPIQALFLTDDATSNFSRDFKKVDYDPLSSKNSNWFDCKNYWILNLKLKLDWPKLSYLLDRENFLCLCLNESMNLQEIQKISQ